MPLRTLTLAVVSAAAALGAIAEIDHKITRLADAQVKHLQLAVHCGDARGSRVDYEFTARIQNAEMPAFYRAVDDLIAALEAAPRPENCEAELELAAQEVAEAKKDVFP